jgi:hypothetical protein
MFTSSVSGSGSRFVSQTTFSDAVRIQDSTISLSRKQSACLFEEVAMKAMNVADEPRFAAFAAIDWGDSKHVWSLQPADTGWRECGKIEHTPEAVSEWVAMLGKRFSGQPVAVALEQSRGALVFMLGSYEQLHIYPVHPGTSSQFRAALYPSGAKRRSG